MTATPPPNRKQLGQLNALLETALALPPGERDGWLDGLSDEQRALRPSLERLLARAATETDSFLSQPLSVRFDDMASMQALPDQPGDTVGPYRLLRELGRGGTATVWLAERADGVLHRQVALKLPHEGWSLGLAQRMGHEREILASLAHARIARLYDAGITEQGRPWLAMECVAGVPIDQFCREQRLGTRARVRLFLQVLDAVAHAHARLVVHRDLKPSNILVTPEGDVRLLDFGIAKLLHDASGAAPDLAPLTEMLGRAVTPDYASPEQVSGRQVTVASDVYSLGIVLFELLAGQRPYRLGRPGAAALEEAIVAADVPRASQLAQGDRRLARELRGDLDTVLAKALRKNPERRYPSVESFAADLQRYLDGEAVLAQPPSRRYRLLKFVRRHRWSLAASAAVAVSLTTGAGVALWQAQEARRQAAFALGSLDKAEASFDFASAVLMEGVGSDESISLRELLDRSSAMAERSFAGTPTERAVSAGAVATWLGTASRYREAEALLSRALGSMPPDADVKSVASLRCQRGHARSRMGRHAEGVIDLDAGTAMAINADALDVASYCLHRRAVAARDAHEVRAELDYMQRALDAHRRSQVQSRHTQAHLLADLAESHWINGQVQQADRLFEQSLATFDAMGRADSQQALSARHNRALSLAAAGAPLQAMQQYDQVMAAEQRRSPSGQVSMPVVANRASALLALSRYPQAEAEYRRLLARATASGDVANRLRAFCGLAATRLRQGDLAGARQHIDAATVLMKTGAVPATGTAANSWQLWHALVLQGEGRHAEADAGLAALADAWTQAGVKIGALVNVLASRSEIALAQGRIDEALQLARRALSAGEGVQGDLPHSLFTGRAWLAIALVQQARGEAAAMRDAASNAERQLRGSVGPGHPLLADAARLLAGSR